MPHIVAIAMVLGVLGLASCKSETQETGHQDRAESNPSFNAKLTGVMQSNDPKLGVAFIRSTATNIDVLALMNEAITDAKGKPFDEFAGWKLVEVGADRAVFTNGVQRVTLQR